MEKVSNRRCCIVDIYRLDQSMKKERCCVKILEGYINVGWRFFLNVLNNCHVVPYEGSSRSSTYTYIITFKIFSVESSLPTSDVGSSSENVSKQQESDKRMKAVLVRQSRCYHEEVLLLWLTLSKHCLLSYNKSQIIGFQKGNANKTVVRVCDLKKHISSVTTRAGCFRRIFSIEVTFLDLIEGPLYHLATTPELGFWITSASSWFSLFSTHQKKPNELLASTINCGNLLSPKKFKYFTLHPLAWQFKCQ